MIIGIGKTLNKKLEDANYCGLRTTIMNTGKCTYYDSILKMLGMKTLEHKRIEQSLIIFFKCFKENGHVILLTNSNLESLHIILEVMG